MDKKTVDLLNRDIDGVTSPEERARLQKLMDADGELLRLHSDLQQLTASLSNTAKVTPPPSLKAAVMRSVVAPPRVPARWPLPERMKILFRPLADARIGLVFAAGVIAGIVLYVAAGSVLPSSVKEIDLTGALVPHSPGGEISEASTMDLTDGGAHVTLATSYGRNVCFLRLNVLTPGNVRTQLLFDNASVQISGIRLPPEGSQRVLIEGGKVEIVGGPVDDMTVMFAPRGTGTVQPLVTLRVAGPEGNLVERSIPVVPPSNN